MTRLARRPLHVFVLVLAAAPALVATSARAQRCVAAADIADLPAQDRYCGVPLITTTLGGAPLGGTAGFGNDTSCMSQNDDGSSPSINITPYFAAGLRFFAATPHTSLFVNTNGNITFSGPEPTYTPMPFPVAGRPMIAPFWADVDIRSADGTCSESVGTTCASCTPCEPFAENQVWWAFEPGRALFTWDEVGYYNCQTDRRMSFQLVLTEVTGTGCGGGAGDFDVEFRFNRCEWDTGDASGGTGGFMGAGGADLCFFGTCLMSGAPCPTGACPPAMTAAQSGFDAGNGTDFVEISSSRVTRTITRRLCEESNIAMPGIWQFQIRSGGVVCPDAGDPCVLPPPLMGACAMGRTNCVGGGTECVQQVFSEDERCDNVDNDCNGTADDGDDAVLCGPGFECRAGTCVENCFESACGGGLVCVAPGVCVEPGCETVMCPEGERCRGGACVPACDGVTCPFGQTCTAGRCIDPCAGLDCDDCSVCEAGTCELRCTMGRTCPAGTGCEAATGACRSPGCAGVTCGAGTHCEGGACVDSCTGVTCPLGQECRAGACVAIPRPDAGPTFDVGPPLPDAGPPTTDGGGMSGMDGGPGALDAGRARPVPGRRDCGCRVPGAPSAPTGMLLSLALATAAVLARRRAR